MAAPSVLYSILTACQARLQSLTFDGIGSGQILIRMLPRDQDTLIAATVPGILISPLHEPRVADSNFGYEVDVTYPVEFFIVAPNYRDPALLDRATLWLQQTRRAFGRPTLAGVPSVWKTEVDPAPFFDHDFKADDLYANMTAVVRFTSHESRI